MPNWCNNRVTLTHADPVMIDRAVKAYQQGRLLNEFIPVPQELVDTVASPGTQEEALVAQRTANTEKFGFADWYTFCLTNWGTKWDVGGDGEFIEQDSPNEVELAFDSAWAPPIAAYEQLEGLGFEIEAYYFEPGMAFCGVWTNEFGDDYCEYTDMTPDEIREQMPEIDERFCISDMLEEWAREEAENEENQEIDLDGGVSATNE